MLAFSRTAHVGVLHPIPRIYGIPQVDASNKSFGVPPSLRFFLKSPWLTGTAVAITVFARVVGFDQVAERDGLASSIMLALDGSVGALCGWLVCYLLRMGRAHQRAVLQRLHLIAEMNHHIRNALDCIELSAHSYHNAALVDNIDSAVARIEWTLREILPHTADASECPDATVNRD